MPFKKGDFVKTKRPTKQYPTGSLCRVLSSGKKVKVAIAPASSMREVFAVELDSKHATTFFEPATFESKFPVFNEIDFSKVRVCEAMTKRTLALSGYLTYQGVKIAVNNNGSGASTSFYHAKFHEEISRKIKEQVNLDAENIDEELVDLDMAVEWSKSDMFGLVDFDEYVVDCARQIELKQSPEF